MPVYQCSVFFIDSRKRGTSRSFEIDAISDSAAKTILDGIVSALADISDARIWKASVSLVYDVIDAEASVSNIDEGASIRVQLNTSPTRFASFNVPAPEASIIDDDGDVILYETDVLALESALKVSGVKIAHPPVCGFVSGVLDR